MNRILVIEDDPAILRGLADNLRHESYDVLTAADGERGYELIRENQPDLVILDLMLPGLDGYGVCRRIRRDGFDTPVLMLTAQDLETHRVAGFEAGADDYVTKPFSVRELLGRVRAILRRSESRPDLDEARRIQESLLPADMPQLPGFRIAAAWRPARTVGGDYFDVMKLDKHRVGVCIADVCGKGMPAALMMANLQAAVKAYASSSKSPREVCEALNQALCENGAARRFISLFYAVIDSKKKTCAYCNAGHNPPILSRDGGCIRLDQGGGVLGIFKEWRYEQGEIHLLSGDRLLMYTDGVTESRNADGEEFGEDRLMDLMEAAGSLTDAVVNRATAFSNGKFDDDLTVVTVSVD
jgi:sigma-B regulation protein RsbU (phosphoserine phosphatase)